MEYVSNCLACNSSNCTSYIETGAMMHTYSTESYNFDRCTDCGLVFLNPRIPESRLGEFYTSAYLPYRAEEAWGKYASFVQKDQEKTDAARIGVVKKYATLNSASRVLDVGCGKPTFLRALGKMLDSNLIGIDFSNEGWKYAPESFSNIDLRIGEIADLSGELPMDVITMWHYLEHDYQPQHHLRDLLAISHSETKLVIEVPNFDSYTRRKFGKYWAGYHTPRHTGLYSPENIKVLLENSGWQIEKVLNYGSLNPYTLHWMSEMEKKQIDWGKSMEPRFIRFVVGMILHAPIYFMQKLFSMGFMTVIAKPI